MAAIDEILLQLIDFSYHPYKEIYPDLRKKHRSEAIRIALVRAEKKGWLEKNIDNDQVFIKLTNLGQERLGRKNEVRRLLPWQLEEGEASFCIVVFDIPEKSRSLRDLLRKKLRDAGFVGWQRSVWVGKNINLPHLREFLAEAGLTDFVLAFETNELGNNKLEELLASFK